MDKEIHAHPTIPARRITPTFRSQISPAAHRVATDTEYHRFSPGRAAMNDLLARLDAGDRRPDGATGEVAAEVLAAPALLPLLAEGMRHPDERIRARTSRAMERIACADPDLVRPLTARFIELAGTDPEAAVRWRYAVILGSIPYTSGEVDADVSVLLGMLHERSVLVRRWAVVSLTAIAQCNPERKEAILTGIRPLAEDPSAIIRLRARRSLDLLG